MKWNNVRVYDPHHAAPNVLTFMNKIFDAGEWVGIKNIYFVRNEDKDHKGCLITALEDNFRAEVRDKDGVIILTPSEVPCIVINAMNDEVTMAFTLLHEIAHNVGIKDEIKADEFVINKFSKLGISVKIIGE